MKEKFNYSLPFSEYMKNAAGKFSIVITKSQYAIEVGGLIHEGMTGDLIMKTRPDIKTDAWGNAFDTSESYTNGNIIIMGYPQYVLVELPKSEFLSSEQFESLKSILLEIKKYNDTNHKKGYGIDYELMVISNDFINGIANIETDYYENNIEKLLKELEKCVSEDVIIPDEVIIGTKFKKLESESEYSHSIRK